MKRILFIHHLPPPLHGPALVGEYIRQSRVINSSFDCRYINLSISASVDDLGQKSLRKFFRYVKLIWQVKKQLILFRPDFCYMTPMTQGSGFYKDALIIAIVKLFGVSTIFHYHNNGIRTRQDKPFDDLLYRFAFRNTKVILLSKLLYPDVQKYVLEDRVYYCPNGIPEGGGRGAESGDKERSDAVPRSGSEATQLRKAEAQGTEHRAQSDEQGESMERLSDGATGRLSDGAMERDISKSPPLSLSPSPSCLFAPSPIPPLVPSVNAEILFLSHLVESKGVYVLVDALKLLKDKNIAFHCTMIGGEGDITAAQLQTRIEMNSLGEHITLAGKKYGAGKEAAFEQADIFVHPTYLDCMPLVLLEAMQHSLPIVSTFEGAIPDVVEDGVTGFLVPQKDPEALAEKLELLINNPELRKKMGEAGRGKYEREFTLERFERRMVEILGEVGGEQGADSRGRLEQGPA